MNSFPPEWQDLLRAYDLVPEFLEATAPFSSVISCPQPQQRKQPATGIADRSAVILKSAKRSNECEHCKKKFSDSSHRRRHLLIHTGETPYKCQHCGKAFNQSSTLKTHLRIHTGETPYECERCGMKFRNASNLKRHLRIHSGENPYRCQHCNKQYYWLSSLKNHNKSKKHLNMVKDSNQQGSFEFQVGKQAVFTLESCCPFSK